MDPSEKGPFGILTSKAEPAAVTDVSFNPLISLLVSHTSSMMSILTGQMFAPSWYGFKIHEVF
jgi:hypothetical protein